MNKQTVLKLINMGESSTVEFKLGKRKDFTKSVYFEKRFFIIYKGFDNK